MMAHNEYELNSKECEELIKQSMLVLENKKLYFHSFKNFYELFKRAAKHHMKENLIKEYAHILLKCDVECANDIEIKKLNELKDSLNTIIEYKSSSVDGLSFEDILDSILDIEIETADFYESKNHCNRG